MRCDSLLIELFVEELPPKVLNKLGLAFAENLHAHLRAQDLTSPESVATPFASPRRLAVHITQVKREAPDKQIQQKLMPVSVGLNETGQASPALLKKLQSLGLGPEVVNQLTRAPDGKTEALFYDSFVRGATLNTGVQLALDDVMTKLPIPKVMSYQLHEHCDLPGWSSVKFIRPAHGLVVMHGTEVLHVQCLGLKAGNSTQGHRFEAKVNPVVFQHADDYADRLLQDGAVIASYEARARHMIRQLRHKAQECHALLDVEQNLQNLTDSQVEDKLLEHPLVQEVTALVERPNVMVCSFEKQYLEVPQECLILTMKANQKYFPLLDSTGQLSNQFLVVSNISPEDDSAVIGGNERVVRPRLADAKFFYDQDRKKSLLARVEGLDKVVYHHQLGTQGDRVKRVRAIAQGLALLMPQSSNSDFLQSVDTAAMLAKTDLLTDMVGEFPELQGIMGAYYARHDGLSDHIAQAIEDHYKPRFAGDELPRHHIGLVVALADKLETLVGMFGIGNSPSGDRDPFALRRHALGVVRMLSTGQIQLELNHVIAIAVNAFGALINDPTAPLTNFIFDRLSGNLREQGFSAQEVEAVLALRPGMLGEVYPRLEAVRQFVALPQSQALASANKRIGNILKKSPDVAAQVNVGLFQAEAEKVLYAAMQEAAPMALAQFNAGNYTGSLQTLATLREPVDAFFDQVMVNAEDQDLRMNRLGLLKSLHAAMNAVADLSCLAA